MCFRVVEQTILPSLMTYWILLSLMLWGADLTPVNASTRAGARAPVPLSDFVLPGAPPDEVRTGLERASWHSARREVPIRVGPGTYTLGGTVQLAPGSHFVGGGGVIRRSRNARGSYLFEITGGPFRVDGLRVDVNGAGAYAAVFAVRTGGVTGLTFHGLDLFDTREPDPTENYGDRWGVLIAPERGPVQPVRDVTIARCRVRNGIQLTAGYGNRGVRNVRVSHNDVSDPEENGIAFVLAGGPGGIEDVVISDNVIRRVRGVGIYVGVDRDSQAGTFVRNVLVERNRIEGFAHARRGGFGILFRAAELGNEGIVIRDNLVDGSGHRNTVGLRLQAKSQENPNLSSGALRYFDAPFIEGNTFHSVSPAIDLWHTWGGSVRDNRGDVPRMAVVRNGSRNVRISAGGGR